MTTRQRNLRVQSVNQANAVRQVVDSEGNVFQARRVQEDDLKDDESIESIAVTVDNWRHRSAGMICATCAFFVPKSDEDGDRTNLGRCRRRAPKLKGWPAVFETDWCGDHKLDENSFMAEKVNDE